MEAYGREPVEDLLDGEEGKVGFVTILGRPNVGKSTFLNKALNYHIAAVSTRPNTTRKRWLGILSDDVSQIVFVDTPGVHESRNKMHEAMAQTIERCIEENDAILCLCDATRPFGEEDARVAELLGASRKPKFLAINKVDAAPRKDIDEMKARYLGIAGEVGVFEVSALNGKNVDTVIGALRETLPVGPFLFPKDQITDVIMRDVAEEIIREAANELVYQEIPQSLAVKIDTWNENEKKIKIAATIYLERDAQKAIVIGEKGSMTLKITKSAREKLRVDLDKFVDLKLHVKVAADWQNKSSFLSGMGIVDRRK